MLWYSASYGWTTGSHYHTGAASASRSLLPGWSATATLIREAAEDVFEVEATAAKRSLVVQTAQSAFMFADMDQSGTIDFREMNKMMERMMDQTEDASGQALEEVRTMFSRFDTNGDGDLSYNEFLLLLAECNVDSALFNGLLTFAEDAVQAGVLGKLKGGSGMVERRGSHILDDGSPAW